MILDDETQMNTKSVLFSTTLILFHIITLESKNGYMPADAFIPIMHEKQSVLKAMNNMFMRMTDSIV